MALIGVHGADPIELDGWNSHTVDAPGGSVHQSREWADYQATLGWRPSFLVTDDGRRVLALRRPWPLVPGAEAYLPRGPIRAGDDLAQVADRICSVAEFLAADGVDVIHSDPEIPAASGLSQILRERGYVPAEEIQPSRHRLAILLPAGTSSAQAFGALAASTRQRVRHAIRDGLVVVAWDARPNIVDGEAAQIAFHSPDACEPGRLGPELARFHAIVMATSERRRFRVVGVDRFIRWGTACLAGGLGVLLQVRAADGDLLGGALLHRHGGRLTYFIAGDSVEARRQHPGAMHLLVWRVIQLAIAQGLDEVDLGGVDMRGARSRPQPGDAMYGLLAFKQSFGAEWVEQVGNHERVAHRMRCVAGRAARRLDDRLASLRLPGVAMNRQTA